MQDFIGQPEKTDIGRSFDLAIMLILCILCTMQKLIDMNLFYIYNKAYRHTMKIRNNLRMHSIRSFSIWAAKKSSYLRRSPYNKQIHKISENIIQ